MYVYFNDWSKYVCMYTLMNGMYVYFDECMYVCMYVYFDECMYVCIL